MRRLLVGIVAVASLGGPLLTACEDGGETDSGGGAGGVSGLGGAGGEPGCSTEGVGTLTIRIEGLPGDLDADVDVVGVGFSESPTATIEFADVDAGVFTIQASDVFAPDPIVRTLLEPSVDAAEVCVVDGEEAEVTVTYVAHPASNQLWTNNANETAALLGFASALLTTSATVEPTVAAEGGMGNEVVFDREGNLWTVGATLAEAHLLRFAGETLGTSGDKVADREINIADLGCIPAMRGLAFAPDGALFASVCGGELVRLEPAELTGSGTVEPSVVLSEVTENGDLAFDSDGNLWVTSDGRVARYDASRLGTSSSAAPDRLLTVTGAVVSNLAFAADGTLWAVDFGGNEVLSIAPEDLLGDGEATIDPEVTVTIGVSALLERPAFDESGGLWLALGTGSFGRLAPEQLTVSTTAGDPTVPETILESDAVGYANRIAFFPAPDDLPLFHALP